MHNTRTTVSMRPERASTARVAGPRGGARVSGPSPKSQAGERSHIGPAPRDDITAYVGAPTYLGYPIYLGMIESERKRRHQAVLRSEPAMSRHSYRGVGS